MRYRVATSADVDAIMELWAACGLGSGAAVDRTEITTRLASEDDFFVLGHDGDDLVAAVMGCYDGHRGWVKRVAIEPTRRRDGLGRELVSELERRFLAAGISKLRLAVWRENDGALAFWEALDYVELPDIHYFTKDLLGAPDDDC